jgi:hypothetical protein
MKRIAIQFYSYTGVDMNRRATPGKPVFRASIALGNEKVPACFERNDFGNLCTRHSEFSKQKLS